MKRSIYLSFSLLIVAATLLSTACAPVNLAVPAVTPEPTTTAAATPTATPSPVPTLTPVASISPEEKEALLNQQFHDFLNKEGEYTVEKIEEYCPIWGSLFNYEDGNGIGLGILRIFNERSSEEDRNVAAYGYLITVTKDENNNIFLIMGFDGKNGNRFVSELMILGSVYDNYHNLPDGDPDKDRLKFSFSIEEGLHLDDNSTVKLKAASSDEIYRYLESLIGKKIVADIPAKKFDTSEVTGYMITMWEERNNRLPYTFSLIRRLADNGIDTGMIGSSGKDISLIESSDDLNTIDPEVVPIIIGIRFRDNG